MKLSSLIAFLPLAFFTSCGESGERAAGVVEAAAKSASETGHELADSAAALARTAPEQAKVKFQEFVDEAARQFEAVKDSETAHKVAGHVEAGLAQLGEFKDTIASKIDFAALRTKVEELIERFKSDPRVVSALESVRTQIDKLKS